MVENILQIFFDYNYAYKDINTSLLVHNLIRS